MRRATCDSPPRVLHRNRFIQTSDVTKEVQNPRFLPEGTDRMVKLQARMIARQREQEQEQQPQAPQTGGSRSKL